MKKFFTIFLALLLLLGCNIEERTAQKNGKGISVKIGDIDNIRYVGVNIYMDELLFSDLSTYKEEGFFKEDDIVWFDAPVTPGDHLQEIEVIYSRNADGSDPATTNMIDITEAKEWVNTKLNNELQLELLEFK